MRVLQIGSDRSPRGILFPNSPAALRQMAYGEVFDALDVVGFSLKGDGRTAFEASPKTHIYPTNSISKLFYGLDTIRIVRGLPKPDVISAQDPFEAGLLGLLIAGMLKVPLHVQVHTDFLSPQYSNLSIANRIRAIIAGFVLSRAARVRVVSERVRLEIISRYNLTTHISVLPIFVDVARIRASTSSLEVATRLKGFDTTLLVVSRLEPEKNVALAIESFAHSAPESACLVIVGNGSERKHLEELARHLHVASRVFFEGEVKGMDYFALADLVLVPSHYEGYGLVIVEALAAGRPVLATDVGIARDAGAIVADEAHYADALAEWYKDGPRIGELKNYPYQNFEEYVTKYCEDIADCIKK